MFWIQESNILGWRRRIVGSNPENWRIFRLQNESFPLALNSKGYRIPFPVLGNPSTVEITLPRAPKRERCLNFI